MYIQVNVALQCVSHQVWRQWVIVYYVKGHCLLCIVSDVPMYQILKCAYLKYISPMEIKSCDRWEILWTPT